MKTMNKLYENIDTNTLIESPVYRVAPLETNATDTEILSLMAHANTLGGRITEIDDDSIIIKCTYSESFNDIIDYLDTLDIVDEYEVIYYSTDTSGTTRTVDQISVDKLSTFTNFTVEIIVFFKPEYIDYNDYYYDMEDSEDEILTEGINQRQPLWMALNKISTDAPGGIFIVTPHPVKKNNITVYIEYKFDKKLSHKDFYNKNKNSIAKDLDNINKGFIFKKLSDKNFKIKRALKLTDDDINVITTYQKEGRLQTKIAEFETSRDMNVRLLLEMFADDGVLVAESHVLSEVKRTLKINFKGKKRFKMKCQKGFKFDNNRRACVKIGGAEKAQMRKSKIKMVRTKRSKGTGLKNMTVRKQKKAMRFRKLMGK